MVRSCKLTEARTITTGASVVATKMFPTPILFGSVRGEAPTTKARESERADRAGEEWPYTAKNTNTKHGGLFFCLHVVLKNDSTAVPVHISCAFKTL